MENTLENKARLFAQYWGQKLLAVTVNENDFRQKIGNTYMGKYHVEMCHIELKPLSSITNEDKLKIASIFWQGKNNKLETIDEGSLLVAHFSSSHGLFNPVQTQQSFDYLRSKGYAVPFMGLSVEELQEYGWIKLKSE